MASNSDVIETIRKPVREADRQRPRKEMKGAMQAGARRYPEPPFEAPQDARHGIEATQAPQPMYDAPFWQGSGKLEFGPRTVSSFEIPTTSLWRIAMPYGGRPPQQIPQIMTHVPIFVA